MMVVIVISKCPDSLRGDLSKWLFEVDTGVYTGNPTARVRVKLWDRVKKTIGDGRAVMVYSTYSEQGLKFEVYHSKLLPVDLDGIQLMMHPIKEATSDPTDSLVPVYSMKKTRSKKQEKKNQFVVLDIETTGLDPEQDQIIELGALKVEEGKVVGEYQSFIHYDQPLSEFIKDLTGIKQEDLVNAPDEKSVIRDLLEFIGRERVVCHNAKFDLQFLKLSCERLNLDWPDYKITDTLRLARKYVRGIDNYKLDTLLTYFDIPCEGRHRAIEDCKITLKLLENLDKIRENDA